MAQQGFFEGIGGGIYNRGDIVVDGESYMSMNSASVSLGYIVAWCGVSVRVVSEYNRSMSVACSIAGLDGYVRRNMFWCLFE